MYERCTGNATRNRHIPGGSRFRDQHDHGMRCYGIQRVRADMGAFVGTDDVKRRQERGIDGAAPLAADAGRGTGAQRSCPASIAPPRLTRSTPNHQAVAVSCRPGIWDTCRQDRSRHRADRASTDALRRSIARPCNGRRPSADRNAGRGRAIMHAVHAIAV